MTKQFATFHVSWRDANPRPLALFADSPAYRRAAAVALEDKLNDLADDGWIIQDVFPATGLEAKGSAGFTIVAFK
ncbi:MAG: hypothetical protein ACE5FO_05740 [Parvularculaceae bacterium]